MASIHPPCFTLDTARLGKNLESSKRTLKKVGCARPLAAAAFAVMAACTSLPAPVTAPPSTQTAPSFEPLNARVNLTDAYRFVDVYRASAGAPGAEALQAGYLEGAGRGVEIFMPGRIRSAENLAASVARKTDAYARAIDVCLPIVEASNADLRAIYLGLSSLFPTRALPEIHAVFGAFSSGGTAQPDAQVIGIEVICDISPDAEAVRRTLQGFYAHETVHSLQPQPNDTVQAADLLLFASLREGMADFVSHLVTGTQPSPERAEWAKAREAELWAEFLVDRRRINEFVKVPADLEQDNAELEALFGRWHANYNSAPEGWPYEMGYWIGQQICQAYFDQASDKRQAIADLMALEDPAEILLKSGYDPS